MPVFAIAKLVIKEIFRKKDFYAAFLIIAVILFYASQLTFYRVENVVRYLIEIGLLLVFFFSAILTVSLAARQHPSEMQNRTLAVLLSKPVGRFQYVLGKFAGSFAAGTAAFLIFYILFLLIAGAKSPERFPLLLAAQAGYLFLLNLLVLAAMASSLAHYLTLSANVSVTLILYVLMNAYGAGLKASVGPLYYVLPHFEFFDMRQRFIHHWEPLSADLLGVLTAYAAACAGVFLLIGWLKFRRQPL
jgi:ABC-type transport system involved in multi-copper enzyme maturation permease subunit